jgi:hypothetical protein
MSMIIFRPNRGTLVDSIAEVKEFKNEEEMKSHIAKEFQGYISIDDILIGNEVFEDERIGWKDSRYVLTKRMGDDNYITLYGTPQAIGTCATIYSKGGDNIGDIPLPKYNLDESVNIRAMNVQLKNVIITTRIVKYDFDKGLGDSKFFYDLKHNISKPGITPWTLDDVLESDLDGMIYEYKDHEKKLNG